MAAPQLISLDPEQWNNDEVIRTFAQRIKEQGLTSFCPSPSLPAASLQGTKSPRICPQIELEIRNKKGAMIKKVKVDFLEIYIKPNPQQTPLSFCAHNCSLEDLETLYSLEEYYRQRPENRDVILAKLFSVPGTLSPPPSYLSSLLCKVVRSPLVEMTNFTKKILAGVMHPFYGLCRSRTQQKNLHGSTNQVQETFSFPSSLSQEEVLKNLDSDNPDSNNSNSDNESTGSLNSVLQLQASGEPIPDHQEILNISNSIKTCQSSSQPKTPASSRYSFLSFKEQKDFGLQFPDAKITRLTSELLHNPLLRPIAKKTIQNKTFYLSKIFKRSEDRDMAIMYTENPAGFIVPRALYKSRSDGGWRVTPGYLPKEKIYSKGMNIHYTQETKLVSGLTEVLEEIEDHNHLEFVKEDMIKTLFTFQDPFVEETNTFHEEINFFDDTQGNDYGGNYANSYGDRKSILKEFRKYPPAKSFKKDSVEGKWYKEGLQIHEEFSKLSFSDPDFPLPDFSKPKNIYFISHMLISTKEKRVLNGITLEIPKKDVQIEVFPGVLKGKPIEWHMAYHPPSGRVWIERIVLVDNQVSSYGTNKMIINSGALTNKPLEYKNQTTLLKIVDPLNADLDDPFHGIPFDETYHDITPLLNYLKPIEEYKKAKGPALTPFLPKLQQKLELKKRYEIIKSHLDLDQAGIQFGQISDIEETTHRSGAQVIIVRFHDKKELYLFIPQSTHTHSDFPGKTLHKINIRYKDSQTGEIFYQRTKVNIAL